jgi:hypothetical protein
VEIARGEMVEKELDAMIARRSRQQDSDEESELWQESVRRHKARRREEMREAWGEYHRDQAERHRRTLQDLVRHHEEKAEELCEEARHADDGVPGKCQREGGA